MADEGDWLSQENFDFELNLSKSSVENLLNDDDEVFTGEQGNKGVQSNTSSHSVEGLLPRESAALLTFKMKNSRSTPVAALRTVSNMKSPVAVVHPMRRDGVDGSDNVNNKENIPINRNCDVDSSIGIKNLSLSSSSSAAKSDDMIPTGIHSNTPASSKEFRRLSLTHKKFLDSPIGLVEPFSADQKLDEKQKGKVKLEGGTKINANSSTKIKPRQLKKVLMIPKPVVISKSKSGGAIPSSLPTRPTKQDTGTTSGMKPLKAKLHSYSGISQSQEKPTKVSQLKMPGRKYVSVGTPESSCKITNKIPSSRKKLTSSSSVDTPLHQKKMIKPPKSATKQNSLPTPVAKPPRKSIFGRKLNPTDDEITKSQSSLSVDKHCADDESTNSVPDADVEQSLLSVDKQPESTKLDDDIKQSSLSVDIQDPSSDNVFEQNINCISEPVEAVVKSSSTIEAVDKLTIEPIETVMKDSKVDDLNCDPKFVFDEVLPQDVSGIEETAPLLIDISISELPLSPINVNVMDPFKTGDTPPPLIQLDMILEPERPPELNLIEF